MSGIATLPIENPVLIFFIVLVIILFAPILLNRIRVPHIIGLIIAGVIIGPNGLNLLARDSSFEIFGNVGILYLMFLAGLEIDMYDFKKSKKDGIIFGLYTFLHDFRNRYQLLHPPSQPNDFHTIGKYVRLAYADSLPHYQQIWNIP